MQTYILSIDQGTTSSRTLLVDQNGKVVHSSQQEFTQYYPNDGWVEHDPREILKTTLYTAKEVLEYAKGLSGEVAAIGITNQRETTIVWDRSTGEPIYNAIVWQDRRTAEFCRSLYTAETSKTIQKKTGLLLDPYFSATKLAWILDQIPGARQRADRGDLAFGTVDSFLIWHLTGGTSHTTDATNASRTMMFNIRTNRWDQELLELFSIPENCLPEVRDCADNFGITDQSVLGQTLPIQGVAGDQQAALIGQACFEPGMLKSTYGTGCFLVINTGTKLIQSRHRLLSTIGYRLEGQTYYAMEGSIFVAGAAMQWLRDEFQIFQDSSESADLALSLADNCGVYMVPALTGLGAPHWLPDARGAIFGMTRDTGKAQFARAALESVAYQSVDLLEAIQSDGGTINRLRVDGGMVNNNWFCQFLSDMLNLPVDRPENTETTALGAAYLAGIKIGLYKSLESISKNWSADCSFESQMDARQRNIHLRSWKKAVDMVAGFAEK
ncbi:MAG: glycerol kinase GlpK [Gammaproteobacteria bacterium]|nr:glycerol kinase GlpK [Gammaproteobacteria bacterium]MCY4219081.1 glycerol kinase GlpK [Gammaproteobacteria bacterium]MCY4275261.1 glycerol kinase GlpK [Gammaproteobacteria bacterium]